MFHIVDETHEMQTKMVRVELDGVKADLILVDSTVPSLEDMDSCVMESADAYVIVYSVDDRESFIMAQQLITVILGMSKRSSALILVANKNDLARTRMISREGEWKYWFTKRGF
ncbi:hypothetical protein Ciccas_000816 [Cichlidogyrus casuarinus]|uniref:Uncharacterized protein n=1 Tax=Cichlidogyrus casuarinus TaxID=1844966 RepID=A0ABD2QMA8_9PLAT